MKILSYRPRKDSKPRLRVYFVSEAVWDQEKNGVFIKKVQYPVYNFICKILNYINRLKNYEK